MDSDRETAIKKMMRYRWIIYAVGVACYFFVFFHRLSMGVVKDDLVKTFGITSVTYANLSNTYFCAYLIMQIPSGMLADNWGPRKSIAAGVTVAAFGAFLFGFSPVVEVAFLGRFLVALGIATVYPACMRNNAVWFRSDEFGRMTGLTGFIGNLGGMFAQFPLAFLVGVLTWRYTYYVIAATSLFLAILAISFIRNKPEDIGAPSMAEIEGEVKKSRPKVTIREGMKNMLQNRSSWLLLLIFGLYAGSYITFSGTWAVPFFQNVYKISKMDASKYSTLLVSGVCIGYLITGYVSDKIKSRKKPLVALGALLNILWFVILYYNDGMLPVGMLSVVLFLMGFGVTSMTMCFSLAKELNDPDFVATSIAFMNMGPYIFGIIISPITGGVLDKYAGVLSGIALYRGAVIYFPICTVLAFIASLFVKETHCRNIYWDDKEKAIETKEAIKA